MSVSDERLKELGRMDGESEEFRDICRELRSARDRLAIRCQHPNVETCAREWQADTNSRQLRAVDSALADEFPFDCDMVEHLATALLAARKELRAAREVVAKCPHTADGNPIAMRDIVYALVQMNDDPPAFAVVCGGFVSFEDDWGGMLQDGDGNQYWGVAFERCYSTREAAERAGKGEA